jgi:hypothetical protein
MTTNVETMIYVNGKWLDKSLCDRVKMFYRNYLLCLFMLKKGLDRFVVKSFGIH